MLDSLTPRIRLLDSVSAMFILFTNTPTLTQASAVSS